MSLCIGGVCYCKFSVRLKGMTGEEGLCGEEDCSSIQSFTLLGQPMSF